MEKCYVEEACNGPIENMEGFVCDCTDMVTGWEEKDGCTILYLCDEENEFTASKSPHAVFYGEPPVARRAALRYLFFINAMTALEFVHDKAPDAVEKYEWLIDMPFRILWGTSFKETMARRAETTRRMLSEANGRES